MNHLTVNGLCKIQLLPKFFIGFCKYPYIFSLNIVNDKIFLIEWFWFVALVTVAIFTFSSRYKNMFFKTSLASKTVCQYIFNSILPFYFCKDYFLF